MARGSIKDINNGGATRISTGTIIRNNGGDIKFSQPFLEELGGAVGVTVNFEIVSVGGVNTAVRVKPVERGVIQTIDADNMGGTLLDTAYNIVIPFKQSLVKESGLAVDTEVAYERIIPMATATPAPGVPVPPSSPGTVKAVAAPIEVKYIAVALRAI